MRYSGQRALIAIENGQVLRCQLTPRVLSLVQEWAALHQAELIRAMGYRVPFVAPPGRDGGIDVVAYKDPLGTTAPRIRVQVKHRDQKSTVRDVRELEGLPRKEGDIGLVVSSGGFTTEVEREIRNSTQHI